MNDAIHQLIYISAATHEFTEEDLARLLVDAREKNARRGITGMLLFHGGSFIQALEGDKATVEQLYQRIARDPRHVESTVLFRGEVPERDFSGWHMGYYRSNQTASENLEGFHNFLRTGFRQDIDKNNNTARKALLAFREGKWHKKVDAA